MNPSRNDQKRLSDLTELLSRVLELMGLETTVEVTDVEGVWYANIIGGELNVLTGGRGRTLNALQCLANAAVNQTSEEWQRVVVDADGYRERRKEDLETCAMRTAEQALAENRAVELEPMNSFERRIVHCALAEKRDVKTDSRGVEPYRFVVVEPAKDTPNTAEVEEETED